MSDSEPNKKQRKLKTYPGLKPADFMHPWDIKATATLRAVPGLDALTKKIMEYGLERIFYLQNVADNVRVTEKMFPRLYKYLQWGCKILDVPEPELYVSLTEQFESHTYGHTRPFIVLGAELVEMLDEEERFFMIAHELGHIKAEHVLYTVVAENASTILEVVGRATLGIGSLVGTGLALPLYDWYRKAALSADRAALLCVQDPDIATRVFMKLAGGATGLYSEMDHGEFTRQIRAYEDRDDSKLDKAYKLFLTVFRKNPFPIMRAKYLDEWVTEGGFASLSRVESESS